MYIEHVQWCGSCGAKLQHGIQITFKRDALNTQLQPVHMITDKPRASEFIFEPPTCPICHRRFVNVTFDRSEGNDDTIVSSWTLETKIEGGYSHV